MTKKEYVFKFLDKVKDHREKESIIRDYLSKNDDVEYTEYLYTEFTKIVNNIISKRDTIKMWSLLWSLDKIKKQESDSQEAEKEDLDNLEKIMNNL